MLDGTKLSKNTLSKTLAELKHEKVIRESLTRAGKFGRPVVLYSIAEEDRGTVLRILGSLSKFRHLEEMAYEYA